MHNETEGGENLVCFPLADVRIQQGHHFRHRFRPARDFIVILMGLL